MEAPRDGCIGEEGGKDEERERERWRKASEYGDRVWERTDSSDLELTVAASWVRRVCDAKKAAPELQMSSRSSRVHNADPDVKEMR
jgi:hypothetical protein